MVARHTAKASPFYYGWVIVVVGGVANAARVSSAVEVSAVFVPALASQYGWSLTVIASATTIGGVATAFLGPFVGRAIDRYGARVVVPVGSLIVGIGCLTLSEVRSPALFVIVYAMVRMGGQSLVQFPNQVTVAKWFERRRGTAIALLMGIGASGLIIAPVAVQSIIESAGIGAAWTALGVLALVLGVGPPLLFMARRPEDLGLRPDGAAPPKETPGATAIAEDGERDWTLHEAVATRAFWLIAGAGVLFSVSSTGVGFHQLAYYVDRGIDASTAAAVVSTFAFGLTAGGLFWGWLADRISVQWLLTAQYVAASLLMLFLLTVHGPAQAFPFAFGFGMLVGGAMALSTLLIAAYFGRRHLGAIAGVQQMTRGLSLGSGPLVTAVIFDVSGNYETAFFSFAGFCVVAVGMMAMARRPNRSPARA